MCDKSKSVATVGVTGSTETAAATSATLQRAAPEPKLVLLGVKFNEDPQQLGFFLAQVLTYMQVYRRIFPSEEARVRVVTLALEGATT